MEASLFRNRGQVPCTFLAIFKLSNSQLGENSCNQTTVEREIHKWVFFVLERSAVLKTEMQSEINPPSSEKKENKKDC